jgi:hypothetical protein
MSTGKWCQPGVPHKGWTCVDVEDLGPDEADHATCEMCEVMQIRYVHMMTHPDYPFEPLGCGCICAGHMEGDYTAARQREHQFKLRQARRSRWLTRRWRYSRHGNEFLNTDGFNVVVYQQGNTWSARVIDRVRGVTRFSQLPYPTVDAAKLATFRVVTEMQDRRAKEITTSGSGC